MVVHLLSPNDRYDMTYLRNYAVLNVKDRLARIDGVGQVVIWGAGDYAMRVWLDPQKVAELGLSASDVVQRDPRAERAGGGRRGRRLAEPAGPRPAALHQRPGPPAERGGVRRHHRQDRRQRRGDAAARHRPHGARRAGLCAALAAGQQAGRRHRRSSRRRAPTPLQISQNVRATMDELKRRTCRRASTTTSSTTPRSSCSASIEAVVHTLLEAIALVVLVVILFLQTWRASIIPLIAVPVSVVGTFAVMHVFGFSVNALTLFGLVLAIGIVVDDAIVVVENVERNIERGLDPKSAAYQRHARGDRPDHRHRAGAGRGVRAAGLHHRPDRASSTSQFALTVAISTVISAFNSLTLSPALAALLLKGHDAPKDALTRFMDKTLGWFFRPLQPLLCQKH